MLDLIYRYDQWGMRQNHAGHRNNNRLDDQLITNISGAWGRIMQAVETTIDSTTLAYYQYQ